MADPDNLTGPVEDQDHAKSPRNPCSSLRPGLARARPRAAHEQQRAGSADGRGGDAGRQDDAADRAGAHPGLRDLVKPGSVCIDIGAAAGLYTVALSRLAGPTGQVHSVEPVTFAHSAWTKVLGSRSSGNVRHHVTALGAEPGRAVMSVPVGRHGPVTGQSFLDWKTTGVGSNAPSSRGQMEVPVDVQTLDGLCADAGITRLDFVKIDVEGAEMHILEGGQRTIESLQPAMLIEIEARHSERYQIAPEDISGWLLDRGYTMYTWQHGWQQVKAVSTATRNYLFRRPASTAALTILRVMS